MATEINIIIKDSDKTYKQKFLSYDKITISAEDPTLKSYIDEALKGFSGEPEDIIIRTTTVYK